MMQWWIFKLWFCLTSIEILVNFDLVVLLVFLKVFSALSFVNFLLNLDPNFLVGGHDWVMIELDYGLFFNFTSMGHNMIPHCTQILKYS